MSIRTETGEKTRAEISFLKKGSQKKRTSEMRYLSLIKDRSRIEVLFRKSKGYRKENSEATVPLKPESIRLRETWTLPGLSQKDKKSGQKEHTEHRKEELKLR